MKKLFVLLLATFCIGSAAFAQTPQLLNYQGVARNGFGNALPNRLMTLRLSIRNGGSSGAIVYQETRSVTTNAGGLYSVQIGSTGTSSVVGSMATINWQVGTKFLQVEVDPEAGTNFIDLGTTQLVSVPYAMSAGVANPVGAAGGDLSGTFPNPSVANGAINTIKLADAAVTTFKLADQSVTTTKLSDYSVTNSKLADGSVTDAKIVTVSGSKVTGNISGNAANVTGTVAVANGGTGATTAAAARTNLGLGNVDNTSDLNKPISTATQAALDLKENLSNKSTSTSLGTSDALYPTQNAVKSYVDGQIVSNATPDATTLVKGKVQLAGDLTGTAALPTVAAGAITTAKLADGSVTDAKIVTVAGSKVTGNISGNAANVTGTVAVANGGTGATTAAGAITNLGGTTVGGNFFTLTNPSAITFPRINANNTIDALSASDFRTAIGAGTSSTSGTVTSVAALTLGTTGTDLSSSVANGATTPVITLNVPDASATARGVITTGTQTIAGAKTFSSDLTVNGITVGKGLNSITNNTAIGTSALTANTTGSYNTANGYQSLYSNTSGVTNTANGYQSLYSNTTGEDNTAIGVNAISTGSGTTNGSRNTAVGRGALQNGNSANDNTAIGAYTMNLSTTGSSNVALGNLALYSTTSASYNVGVGFETLKNTTTGGSNTAVGRGAMFSNTSGDVNTAVGENALVANTSGRYNTSIGVQAQEQNTDGGNNTAIGVAAIDQNRSGSNNAVLGAFAGRHFGANYAFLSDVTTNISNSVLVGYDARPLANNSSNEIVIGYNAVGNGSNTIQLGNSSITNVKTSGAITGASFIKSGGTSSQFLMADGSSTLSPSLVNATALPLTTGVSGTLPVANGGTGVTSSTGSGNVVLSTSPTLTTPALGVATATSINKVVITAPATSSTLTIANGKTLTANNSVTLAGTDGTTMTFPSSNATLASLAGSETLTNKTINGSNNTISNISLTSGVTGTLPVANGGTGQSTFSNGELLIGNTTGNTLTKSTLTAGDGITITNGSGSITIASSSPLPTSNTAGDMLYWNGSAWVKVAAGTDGQVLTFLNGVPTWTTALNPVISTVVSGSKIWMDRNLGASQVATSTTDASSYGYLYQWGRGTDGHQIRTSGTTGTLSNSDQPGNANFIITTSSPLDWRSGQNDNLWQGVNGINNPCPIGFRLPTQTEWNTEKASWSSQDGNGAMNSPLKLPMAGWRLNDDNPSTTNGAIWQEGYRGYYWSSTISGTNSSRLAFANGVSVNSSTNRSEGNSVRCIKD